MFSHLRYLQLHLLRHRLTATDATNVIWSLFSCEGACKICFLSDKVQLDEKGHERRTNKNNIRKYRQS